MYSRLPTTTAAGSSPSTLPTLPALQMDQAAEIAETAEAATGTACWVSLASRLMIDKIVMEHWIKLTCIRGPKHTQSLQASRTWLHILRWHLLLRRTSHEIAKLLLLRWHCSHLRLLHSACSANLNELPVRSRKDGIWVGCLAFIPCCMYCGGTCCCGCGPWKPPNCCCGGICCIPGYAPCCAA